LGEASISANVLISMGNQCFYGCGVTDSGDCSPAMTNRNNAVQTESITLAIADAINRLSVVVSKELNELSNMIERSDD